MTYDCYVWSPYWTWAHSYFSSCVVLAVYCSLLIWSWLTIQQGSIQPTTHYTTNNILHNQPPKWTVTPNCDLRSTEKGQWSKRKPGNDFVLLWFFCMISICMTIQYVLNRDSDFLSTCFSFTVICSQLTGNWPGKLRALYSCWTGAKHFTEQLTS